MATLAIITGPSHKDQPDTTIAGLTLVRRLVRQLVNLQRIEQIWIDANTFRPDMQSALLGEATTNTSITLLSDLKDVTVAADDTCLLLNSRTLVDDRILEHLSACKKNETIGHREQLPFESGENHWHPLVLPGRVLLETGAAEKIGCDTLNELMRSHPRPSMNDLPTYMENRRRKVPLLLHHVTNDENARQGSRCLVDAAQKGVLDWPAWYIHRPLENRLALLLSKAPVTPNQITLLTGLLGFFATALFAQGRFLEALAIALCVGVLDGVDGKLARIKLLTSKAGEFEHVLDKIVEYSWYVGMAMHLSGKLSSTGPMVMATALILFLIADEIQCEFFRRMSGQQICDASSFDRAFRLIGGRRNTHMWVLIPFVLTGYLMQGFVFICLYGVGTFFVHQARFVINARRVLEEASDGLRETFRKTKVI